MSRIPARLRPAYQEDIWVVRGKFARRLLKNCEATKASKPKRISRNTARLLPISQSCRQNADAYESCDLHVVHSNLRQIKDRANTVVRRALFPDLGERRISFSRDSCM